MSGSRHPYVTPACVVREPARSRQSRDPGSILPCCGLAMKSHQNLTSIRAELTEEWITEGMARAESAACPNPHARCCAFPDPLEDARKTCKPKGRCKIGWIVAEDGRTSSDVWLDLHTGEGRLLRQPD